MDRPNRFLQRQSQTARPIQNVSQFTAAMLDAARPLEPSQPPQKDATCKDS